MSCSLHASKFPPCTINNCTYNALHFLHPHHYISYLFSASGVTSLSVPSFNSHYLLLCLFVCIIMCIFHVLCSVVFDAQWDFFELLCFNPELLKQYHHVCWRII